MSVVYKLVALNVASHNVEGQRSRSFDVKLNPLGNWIGRATYGANDSVPANYSQYSPRHCKVMQHAGHWYVMDYSSNGTFIKKGTSWVRLCRGTWTILDVHGIIRLDQDPSQIMYQLIGFVESPKDVRTGKVLKVSDYLGMSKKDGGDNDRHVIAQKIKRRSYILDEDSSDDGNLNAGDRSAPNRGGGFVPAPAAARAPALPCASEVKNKKRPALALREFGKFGEFQAVSKHFKDKRAKNLLQCGPAASSTQRPVQGGANPEGQLLLSNARPAVPRQSTVVAPKKNITEHSQKQMVAGTNYAWLEITRAEQRGDFLGIDGRSGGGGGILSRTIAPAVPKPAAGAVVPQQNQAVEAPEVRDLKIKVNILRREVTALETTMELTLQGAEMDKVAAVAAAKFDAERFQLEAIARAQAAEQRVAELEEDAEIASARMQESERRLQMLDRQLRAATQRDVANSRAIETMAQRAVDHAKAASDRLAAEQAAATEWAEEMLKMREEMKAVGHKKTEVAAKPREPMQPAMTEELRNGCAKTTRFYY